MSKDGDSDFFLKKMAAMNVTRTHAPGQTRLSSAEAHRVAGWAERRVLAQMSDTEAPVPRVGGEQVLSWCANSARGAAALQRLGRFRAHACDPTLDLHGKRLDEARRALHLFIANGLNVGTLTVLVVHGKGLHSAEGAPLLKAHVYMWLKSSPHVVALCSARECDGGTGAMYVALERNG